MNLRKILFTVLTVSLIFSSCKKSTDLTDAIPSDAAYIVHFDNQSLIRKSETDIFQNPSIQQAINLYKAFIKDQEKIQMLDDFVKNPNTIGLNLKEELYLFTNYHSFGLVLGVNDENRFKKFLLSFAEMEEDVIQKDGKISFISPNSDVVVAWDKSRLLLLGSTSGQGAAITETAANLLKQEAGHSINSVKNFAEFSKSKKDISVFYSLKGLEENFSTLSNMLGSSSALNFMTPFKNTLAEISGTSAGIYTSFEKGKIEVTSKNYYDTPDTEKKVKELTSKVCAPLKGEHLKYISSDPLFVMSTNLKGEGLYDYLDKYTIWDMIGKELDDDIQSEKVKQIVQSISGDITFALTSFGKNTDTEEADTMSMYRTFDNPNILFFADLTNPEPILSLIKENVENDKYTEIAPSIFLIEKNDQKVYFGINNNTFFFTNVESVYNNLNESGLTNNYAQSAKNKTCLIAGSFSPLSPYLDILDNNFDINISLLLSELVKYELTVSDSDYSTEGFLELKSKEKNSLAVICNAVKEIIADIKLF